MGLCAGLIIITDLPMVKIYAEKKFTFFLQQGPIQPDYPSKEIPNIRNSTLISYRREPDESFGRGKLLCQCQFLGTQSSIEGS